MLKKVSIGLAVLLLMVVIPMPVSARRPLFVDDDGVECPNAAYLTIQGAVDDASPGDTIIVCSGIYAEHVVIGTSGIKLIAQGAVLDGSALGVGDGITLLNGVSDLVIKYFEIRGYKGSSGGVGNAIQAWDVFTSNIRVTGNYLHDNSWNGILVGSESNAFMHNGWRVLENVVRDNGYVNIELTNCDGCLIKGNTIFKTTGAPFGLFAGFSYFGIVVQARNTIPGTGLVTVSGVQIKDNVLTDLDLYGIYVLSFTGHPTLFTPIAGASTSLVGVQIKHNTVTDIGSVGIRYWAYNAAASAIDGEIKSENVVNCLTASGNPSIEVREGGVGPGVVTDTVLRDNIIDPDCSAPHADTGTLA